MKIISWNVNGLRSRIFNDKVSSQHKKNEIILPEKNSPMGILLDNYDPDIICLQETRCSVQNGNNFKISNFNSLFNESKLENARGPNRYSGTAIYIKDNFKIDKIEYSIPGYEDSEGRIIIINIEDYIIINVYAPNSSSNFENKKKFMDSFLFYFKNNSNKIIFCGDMNVAIETHFDKTKVEPGPGFYPHELSFYGELLVIGFKDAIDKEKDRIVYTWWDPRQKKENGMSICRNRNKGWRLDYFFVKNITNFYSVCLKEIGENNKNIPLASDHAPILLTI